VWGRRRDWVQGFATRRSQPIVRGPAPAAQGRFCHRLACPVSSQGRHFLRPTARPLAVRCGAGASSWHPFWRMAGGRAWKSPQLLQLGSFPIGAGRRAATSQIKGAGREKPQFTGAELKHPVGRSRACRHRLGVAGELGVGGLDALAAETSTAPPWVENWCRRIRRGCHGR